MLELLLALPFMAAALIALLGRLSRAAVAATAAAAAIGGLVLLILLLPRVANGGIPEVSWPWVPYLGLAFSLRLDGLAWAFAAMVLAIGALVILYAHYYLSQRDSAPRFFAYLMLFMGAMLGMVLAGDLLLLVVFWELTSISSFLLIGYWTGREDAREGARMALTITAAGGLALLGGVLLIGRIVGSFELDAVLAAGPTLRAHAAYPWVLGLVLTGVFTKSAQVPFHFWLPHAMAAPTPVSAYLHSATMVKAGVFLLARLHPALAGTDLFFYVVTAVGAATLLLGAWFAIFQHDLKGLLAYSTISHLGLITLLFGLSTPLAVVAGLFHIFNHATFKASLFMAAGIIDHETGTRDMRKLGNLRHALPFTSALAIIASLAMAGIPLLNGFLSKEMFFAETLEIREGGLRLFAAFAAMLASGLAVAYSLRFVHDTFFGDGPRDVQQVIHEPPTWMKIPVLVLVTLCLLVGIAPGVTIAPLLALAARGTLGDAVPEYSLALWHGLNLPLAMSVGGVLIGIGLYFTLRKLFDLHAIVRRSLGRQLFQRQDDALLWIATRVTGAISNQSLQRSLLWLLLATLLLLAAPTWQLLPALRWNAGAPMPAFAWVLWLALVAGTLGTVALHRQRFIALVVVGVVGLAVSLLFVLFSAPDLALTQLLVEMLTVALVLLALNYLPQATTRAEPRTRRMRDAAIALAAGGLLATLTYAMLQQPLDTVAGELLARSWPEGHGRNVVNVILVDFRGLDTLGEITVFAVAALLIHALLRGHRIAPDAVIAGPRADLPMPAQLAHLLFPLALAVSAYLFLRGHNAPGGGFIAGLVLVMPVLLQYVLLGARHVEGRLGLDYVRLIAMGLAAALATGAAAWLFGQPFLASGHVEWHLPLVGGVSLPSAMGFDTGVYLVVFGGAMLLLSMLGTIKPPSMHGGRR